MKHRTVPPVSHRKGSVPRKLNPKKVSKAPSKYSALRCTCHIKQVATVPQPGAVHPPGGHDPPSPAPAGRYRVSRTRAITIGMVVLAETGFSILMLPEKFKHYGLVVGAVTVVIWAICTLTHVHLLCAMGRACLEQLVRGLIWLLIKTRKIVARLNRVFDQIDRLAKKLFG
jgi:hypothetical protein